MGIWEFLRKRIKVDGLLKGILFGIFAYFAKKREEENRAREAAERKEKLLKEGQEEYRKTLAAIIQAEKPDQQPVLDGIVEQYGLSEDFEVEELRKQFTTFSENFLEQPSISTEEYARFKALQASHNINMGDGAKALLERKHAIWLANNESVLPELDSADIALPLKKGEVVHLADYGYMKKVSTRTERVGYHGPVISFKLFKGVRYRAGDLGVHRTTRTTIDVVDEGSFYITNKRVVFVGQMKNFSIPINKVIKIEVMDEGLLLQKENTMTPRIVELGDYDLPLSVLSVLINEQE